MGVVRPISKTPGVLLVSNHSFISNKSKKKTYGRKYLCVCFPRSKWGYCIRNTDKRNHLSFFKGGVNIEGKITNLKGMSSHVFIVVVSSANS